MLHAFRPWQDKSVPAIIAFLGCGEIVGRELVFSGTAEFWSSLVSNPALAIPIAAKLFHVAFLSSTPAHMPILKGDTCAVASP